MQVHGFRWQTVRVSNLAVTVEGEDGVVSLHSEDPDFAMRLAVALITAHGRRKGTDAGRCVINDSRRMWLSVKPDAWDCARERFNQTAEENTDV